MPLYNDYIYYDYDRMPTNTDSQTTAPYVSYRQKIWEVYCQEREQQDRKIEQMLCDEVERLRERKRHPLFYWKEGIGGSR